MLTPCPAKLPFAVKQPALCEQGKLLTWCGCLPAPGTDLASHPLARKCAGSTSSQCCPVAQKYTVSTSAFLVASCLTTACSKFGIPFILAHVKSLLLYLMCMTLLCQFLNSFFNYFPDFILIVFLLPHLNRSHSSPRLFKNLCYSTFSYHHWSN